MSTWEMGELRSTRHLRKEFLAWCGLLGGFIELPIIGHMLPSPILEIISELRWPEIHFIFKKLVFTTCICACVFNPQKSDLEPTFYSSFEKGIAGLVWVTHVTSIVCLEGTSWPRGGVAICGGNPTRDIRYCMSVPSRHSATSHGRGHQPNGVHAVVVC